MSIVAIMCCCKSQALPTPTTRGGGVTYVSWNHMSPDTLAELAVSLDAIAANMVSTGCKGW
jgi:hypothetical protein